MIRASCAAYQTLYECLVMLSKLLAPSMPFLSEAMYRNLVAGVIPDAPESVHLALWPAYDAALIDEKVMEDMQLGAAIGQPGTCGTQQGQSQGAPAVGRSGLRRALQRRTRQPCGRWPGSSRTN